MAGNRSLVALHLNSGNKERWLLILSLHSPFIQVGSQAMRRYHTFLVDLPIPVKLIQMGPEAYLVHDSTSCDTDINCCERALYEPPWRFPVSFTVFAKGFYPPRVSSRG